MDKDGRCERFNELPEPTKVFLEQLTPEKIKAIDDGIEAAKALKTVGKFWKWTILFILGAFTSAAALGQSLDWLWNKFRGE